MMGDQIVSTNMFGTSNHLGMLGMCNYVHHDCITGKNNRFPFLDILGYLKNTHKNPKFGRVRQVPPKELGWEFPGWDLS